jgi:hypothetical protein
MKKLLLVAVIGLLSFGANGQAQKYLNLGGIGTGLYAGLEFPVASAITIGPAAYTDWDFNRFVLAAKGNYYFDELFGLNSSWDVYLGANAGWRIDNGNDNDDGFNWGAQIGARWFWSDRWGLNAEFGGGSGVNGGLGVTLKL